MIRPENKRGKNEAPVSPTGAVPTGGPSGTPIQLYPDRRRGATSGDPMLEAVRAARRRATSSDGRKPDGEK